MAPPTSPRFFCVRFATTYSAIEQKSFSAKVKQLSTPLHYSTLSRRFETESPTASHVRIHAYIEQQPSQPGCSRFCCIVHFDECTTRQSVRIGRGQYSEGKPHITVLCSALHPCSPPRSAALARHSPRMRPKHELTPPCAPPVSPIVLALALLAYVRMFLLSPSNVLTVFCAAICRLAFFETFFRRFGILSEVHCSLEVRILR